MPCSTALVIHSLTNSKQQVVSPILISSHRKRITLHPQPPPPPPFISTLFLNPNPHLFSSFPHLVQSPDPNTMIYNQEMNTSYSQTREKKKKTLSPSPSPPPSLRQTIKHTDTNNNSAVHRVHEWYGLVSFVHSGVKLKHRCSIRSGESKRRKMYPSIQVMIGMDGNPNTLSDPGQLVGTKVKG
ncbi:uncharacterized protein BDR25DRAFT_86468 [Lindgomyces ingoldianus]|uniref:Uncharacterized protein n=1 Tax=Lindgomyces ingoldianus TaxID=673940 RepID=A0ACB6QEE8_9PLEO|nr:uncharacterized protein BDR25DRAFT_86468 [Lindgomyces ingoldianus]KAF2465364.1 hypothetical protein BDR25DRAFT_86468 [Lindgomyces ingoldianus]